MSSFMLLTKVGIIIKKIFINDNVLDTPAFQNYSGQIISNILWHNKNYPYTNIILIIDIPEKQIPTNLSPI